MLDYEATCMREIDAELDEIMAVTIGNNPWNFRCNFTECILLWLNKMEKEQSLIAHLGFPPESVRCRQIIIMIACVF